MNQQEYEEILKNYDIIVSNKGQAETVEFRLAMTHLVKMKQIE